MGVQDAHRGAQKIACCMCFDISDMLSQGRRRHVEPYCDRRWDMGVPYHTWIKTAVLALEAYWLAEKEKAQADIFNKEDHVHYILGQTKCSLGRIFAPWHNDKLCCLLWNAVEAERAIQNKSTECWVPPFFCFMIMLGHTLLLRLKTSSPHLSGNKCTTPVQPWFVAKWLPHLPNLKKFLGGKRFDDEEKLKASLQKWLTSCSCGTCM